jgi:hypothetical protein
LFPLFATGVVDTGGKIAASVVVDIGGYSPPVSLTPTANLPLAKQMAKFAAGC